MSRGPRAEASRTIARRSIRALAAVADEVLTDTGLHTDATRAWLASWSGERVAVEPWHTDERVRDLLSTLRDARLDVWRHVTHERNAVQRVCVRAAAVIRTHRPDAGDAQAWCHTRHAHHLAEIVRAEMGDPWAERGSR